MLTKILSTHNLYCDFIQTYTNISLIMEKIRDNNKKNSVSMSDLNGQ